ncbi:MAG: hypothetical protein SNJ29_15875 [Rikenellaceae bacterium]
MLPSTHQGLLYPKSYDNASGITGKTAGRVVDNGTGTNIETM